jgi:hypothetical protein
MYHTKEAYVISPSGLGGLDPDDDEQWQRTNKMTIATLGRHSGSFMEILNSFLFSHFLSALFLFKFHYIM